MNLELEKVCMEADAAFREGREWICACELAQRVFSQEHPSGKHVRTVEEMVTDIARALRKEAGEEHRSYRRYPTCHALAAIFKSIQSPTTEAQASVCLAGGTDKPAHVLRVVVRKDDLLWTVWMKRITKSMAGLKLSVEKRIEWAVAEGLLGADAVLMLNQMKDGRELLPEAFDSVDIDE